MKCPFHPPCEADLEPIEQRVAPGSDEVEYVYPIHQVTGADAWFGGCPASHFLILPGGRLTETAKIVLREATKTYHRMAMNRARTQQAANRGNTAAQALTHDLPLPSPVRPVRPVGESFPGRPADAPEPGPDERPAAPVPPGVGGESLGKGQTTGMYDNARENLSGLIRLAIAQMEQIRDLLVQTNDHLTQAEGWVVTAQHQAGSTKSLAAVALGQTGAAGAVLPDAAQKMVENMFRAEQVLRHDSDPRTLIGVTMGRVETAVVYLTTSIEFARAYLASL